MLQLGQLSYEGGAFAEAVTYLRDAIALGGLDLKTQQDVRLSLAVALFRAGDRTAALDEVGRLRTAFPDFAPAKEFEAYLRQ
jgi:hypothetical protein